MEVLVYFDSRKWAKLNSDHAAMYKVSHRFASFTLIRIIVQQHSMIDFWRENQKK